MTITYTLDGFTRFDLPDGGEGVRGATLVVTLPDDITEFVLLENGMTSFGLPVFEVDFFGPSRRLDFSIDTTLDGRDVGDLDVELIYFEIKRGEYAGNVFIDYFLGDTDSFFQIGGPDRITTQAEFADVLASLPPDDDNDFDGFIGTPDGAFAPGERIALADVPGISVVDNLPAPTGDADIITGTAAAEAILGLGGNDTLEGAGGADTLEGGAGDDVLSGGAGLDTAVFSGAFGNYVLSIDGSRDTLGIRDKRADGTGTDTFDTVELLRFGDGFAFVAEGAVDLTQLTGAAALSEAELTRFVEMYIAYFDRAPDALGLLYWGSRLADGMLIEEIAASFFVQPESQALFPDPNDNAALVDAAYRNLLEREAAGDPGREYWIGELENGNVSRGEFMLAIINGAKAETGSAADAKVVAEKGQIGYAYAVERGLTDTANATAVMQSYDRADAEASIAAADALIADFRTAAEAAGSTEAIVELVGLGSDPLGL